MGQLIPYIIIGLLLALLGWLGFRLVSGLMSNVSTEAVEAELQILKRSAEFAFADQTEFAPAYSDQKFIAGDTIRTQPNSKASLEVLGANVIILDENTEVQIETLQRRGDGSKEIAVNLKSGRLWARVSQDLMSESEDSYFRVNTDQLQVDVTGTIFEVAEGLVDTVRMPEGTSDITVWLDETKENSKTVALGTGQQLEVSPDKIELLSSGADLIEALDNDWERSEWHLENLERFNPTKVAEIRREIEIDAPTQAPESANDLELSASLPSPTITYPTGDQLVAANPDNVITIKGTAPKEAAQMVVNEYPLTKYRSGDSTWKYFASMQHGTLKAGKNVFTVYAVDADGKKSKPTSVTFNYGSAESVITPTSTPAITGGTDLKITPATITSPTITTLEEPYRTSQDLIRIAGKVSPDTTRIVVNDFTLEKFEAGSGEFQFFASSEIGNLKPGINTYLIYVYNAQGAQNLTRFQIFFEPPAPTPANPPQPAAPATDTSSAAAPDSTSNANDTPTDTTPPTDTPPTPADTETAGETALAPATDTPATDPAPPSEGADTAPTSDTEG